MTTLRTKYQEILHEKIAKEIAAEMDLHARRLERLRFIQEEFEAIFGEFIPLLSEEGITWEIELKLPNYPDNCEVVVKLKKPGLKPFEIWIYNRKSYRFSDTATYGVWNIDVLIEKLGNQGFFEEKPEIKDSEEIKEQPLNFRESLEILFQEGWFFQKGSQSISMSAGGDMIFIKDGQVKEMFCEFVDDDIIEGCIRKALEYEQSQKSEL